MKKELVILFLVVVSFSFVSARCDLAVTLLNQDPYPAVPGDYVKLVFQVTGTENPDCTYVTLELIEKYPISFDPGESSLVQIKGGTFQKDFSSYLMVPYKVRLDPNALNGGNPVEVRYSSGQDLTAFYTSKLFDIEVEDTHADFEIFIKDYDFAEKTLTLEILNIAESDVEALTLEIPAQENVQIKGARTNIVGDLDSNEYTTAEFNAEAQEGDILVKIYYSDSINARRTVEKTVSFNPDYFVSSDANQGGATYKYIIGIIILGIIIYYFHRRRIKKREHHAKSHKGMAQL